MSLYYEPSINQGTLHLDEDESRHCIKVLRKKNGDKIEIVDGQGTYYEAEITNASYKKCEFRIINTHTQSRDRYHIHIAIAPTKNMDRIEWFVEKCVEIGIHEITFFTSSNSERRNMNLDRIYKKAINALKQSKNLFLPRINTLIPLSEFILSVAENCEKYIAFVDENNALTLWSAAQRSYNYLVLIGPEGDFSHQELEQAMKHGFVKISLGKSRLRTETAGIVACHTLQLLQG